MQHTHIYTADVSILEDAAVFEAARSAVPEERRQKLKSLQTPNARRLSLGAARLLQQVLQAHGIDECTIRYGAHGKPYLGGHPFCFNLAHSGSLVLCAVSPKEVGCDVEHPSPLVLRACRRALNADEAAFLDNLPEEERLDAALRFWTLKESAVKATGGGLSDGLRRYGFRLSADTAQLYTPAEHPPWQFREYRLPNGARIAVCSEVPAEDLLFTELSK